MHAQITTASTSGADRTWFADRIEELLPELYGRALRLCRHRENAEDLVADAVERAWTALHTLDDRSAFRGWIFRILNNAFLSLCRSAHARAEHEPLDTTVDDFSLFEQLHAPILLWWGNPEQEFLNRLLRDDLVRAIDALPDAFRDVVVLVDIQGLAYREVAELLEVPLGTVRSRLSRGRSLLQNALWSHARDAGLNTGSDAPASEPAAVERNHDDDS
jgi:RNA polymerase sigma-70 factor, ECF subfamily